MKYLAGLLYKLTCLMPEMACNHNSLAYVFVDDMFVVLQVKSTCTSMSFYVYCASCLIMTHVTLLAALVSHCAVRPSGNAGRCWCSPLLEVHCENLVSVPHIDVAMANSMWNSGVTYRGLYLNRQHITSLPRAAFSSLPVNRIVLNFNNIGDNIDPDSFLDVDDLRVRHTRHSLQEGKVNPPFNTSAPSTLQSLSEHKQNMTSRPGPEQAKNRHIKRYFERSSVEESLTELFMGACQITSLHVSLFRKLYNLRRLHLWANKIETIPVRMFRHNSQLVELSLFIRKNVSSQLTTGRVVFVGNVSSQLTTGRVVFVYKNVSSQRTTGRVVFVGKPN